MEMMRWGFPPPPNFGNRHVTNVRNVEPPLERLAQAGIPLPRSGDGLLRIYG